MKIINIAIVILIVTNMLPKLAYAGPVSLTRYALVIGSNTGSLDRAELKYAVSDARSFAGILTEMGGVSIERCLISSNPDREKLLNELARLQHLVEREVNIPGRKEVVLYYSGHADETGIILGDDRYSYKEMREKLHAIGVNVRIAVLDACASGSLTREKGGRHRQPFLYDVSTTMEGHAYLTSSSSDEASQESDAIKSSFFTHYLISGMRGPADANRDGKVTLNEAYEFAYDETLLRTEKSKAGPQHAAYDIRLKGSGDLVLTDLRTSRSLLKLMPPVHGRVYIHDAGGRLMVELYKNEGKELEVGLEPGTFEVIVSNASGATATTVTMTSGKVIQLTGAELHAVKQPLHRVRGTSPATTASLSYTHIPFNVSLLPALSVNGKYARTLTNGSISLVVGRTDKLYGLDLSSGISIVSEKTIGAQIAAAACIGHEVTGIQLGGAFNRAGGTCRGLQCAGAVNIAGQHVQGIQLSGAINHAGGEVTGIQLGGAFNRVGGAGKGLQCAGAINTTGKCMQGMQLSGAINHADGQMDGIQVAGAVNHAAGDALVLQCSGIYNYVHGNIHGIQLGGASNFVTGNADGIHLAGACNYIRNNATGMQLSGGANFSLASCTGLLIAGGMNFSKKMSGLQIAGGVNLSGSCTGVQIATVNMCGAMKGLQIGVINICDTMTGIPIGVFNYVKKIPPRYRITADEAGFLYVTVRSGAEHVYSLLSLGTSTMFTRHQWTLGLGLGGRMNMGNGYFALESTAYSIHDNNIWDDESMLHVQNAFVYSYRISRQLSVWGGPAFNLAFTWEKGKERIAYRDVTYRKYGHHWFAAWPGFIGGIEL